MPLPRRPQLALPEAKLAWLTAGMARLAILSVFVILVAMVPTRLSPHRGWIVFGTGAALALAGALLFAGTTRRLLEKLQLGYASAAFLLVLRRTGLPLLALAFFLVWTLVYIALWAVHPAQAFAGLPQRPRFADFFYYAVSTGFISPPGDVIARSRGARSATVIEMMTAFALVTAYISSFVDWYGRGREHD